MTCPICHGNLFPIVDHKLEAYDETVHYSLSGRCPKCKKWFKWEEIYTLDGITPPVCVTD